MLNVENKDDVKNNFKDKHVEGQAVNKYWKWWDIINNNNDKMLEDKQSTIPVFAMQMNSEFSFFAM